MKFKKINMLAVFPVLISIVLAHGGLAETNGQNNMMGYGLFGGMGFLGFLVMGLIIFALAVITIWLIKGDNKK